MRNKIEYTENFKKILTFYLFECPIEDTSQRGQIFAEMGWKGSSRLAMLYRLMQDVAGINDDSWIVCKASMVEKESSRFSSDHIHVICNDTKGQAKSIVYSIRNALAHGAFDVKECSGIVCYIMENRYKGKLRAKLTVPEETLLNWIKLFKTKPEHLTKRERKGKEIKFD